MGNLTAHRPQAREYTRVEALFAVRLAMITLEVEPPEGLFGAATQCTGMFPDPSRPLRDGTPPGNGGPHRCGIRRQDTCPILSWRLRLAEFLQKRWRTMTAKKTTGSQTDGGVTTGYESELWAMADALRGSMDAAGYKHVVLGLIFLTYISDAFEDKKKRLVAELRGQQAEGARLDAAISEGLASLGFGGRSR